MKLNRILLPLFWAVTICFGQAALTNDSVVKLVNAGLGEDVLLGAIQAQPAQYSTGPEDLIALKTAGVGDKVIAAMIAKSNGKIPAGSVVGARAETYHKTHIIDPKGKELPVDLVLDKEKQLLTVKLALGAPIEQAPYASIEKLSYENASHHRVRQGALLMIVSLGAGGVLMLTKEKFHWFYVDYKTAAGESKTRTLKLDKSEYKAALSEAAEQTGKQIETLEKQK